MLHFAEKVREIVTHNRYILNDKVQYMLHPAPWNDPYHNVSFNYISKTGVFKKKLWALICVGEILNFL